MLLVLPLVVAVMMMMVMVMVAPVAPVALRTACRLGPEVDGSVNLVIRGKAPGEVAQVPLDHCPSVDAESGTWLSRTMKARDSVPRSLSYRVGVFERLPIQGKEC